MGNFGDKWIIRIGVSQQGTDRKENFRDSKGRTPLILEDI